MLLWFPRSEASNSNYNILIIVINNSSFGSLVASHVLFRTLEESAREVDQSDVSKKPMYGTWGSRNNGEP